MPLLTGRLTRVALVIATTDQLLDCCSSLVLNAQYLQCLFVFNFNVDEIPGEQRPPWKFTHEANGK